MFHSTPASCFSFSHVTRQRFIIGWGKRKGSHEMGGASWRMPDTRCKHLTKKKKKDKNFKILNTARLHCLTEKYKVVSILKGK